MCDLGTYTTTFKGVVIVRPAMLLLLFTFSYIMSARSMSLNSQDKDLNVNSNVGCAYLESSKELNCFCQRASDDSLLSSHSPEEAVQITKLLSDAYVFKSINHKDIPSSAKLTSETLHQGEYSKTYTYISFLYYDIKNLIFWCY